MMKKTIFGYWLLFIGYWLIAIGCQAQTQVDYDLTAETAVGSGDYTAYQLSTNRYHALATRPNTDYLRGAVNVTHQLAEDWKLSGAVDAIASFNSHVNPSKCTPSISNLPLNPILTINYAHPTYI